MDCTFEDSLGLEDIIVTGSIDDNNEGRVTLSDGLKEWNYYSVFEQIELDVDDINCKLGQRFLNEAKDMLLNVLKEVQDSATMSSVCQSNLSRMATFEVFLPSYVLSKIATNFNRVLNAQGQHPLLSLR
ncbi:unnamed protein product [Agarophyton chilense]